MKRIEHMPNLFYFLFKSLFAYLLALKQDKFTCHFSSPARTTYEIKKKDADIEVRLIKYFILRFPIS